MKLLFRFFVLLCFILLCGQGHTYALKQQDQNYYTQLSLPKKSPAASFVLQHQTGGLVINPILPIAEKAHEKIIARETEDEDDDDDKKDLTFYKNYSDFFSDYFIADFYRPDSGQFIQSTKKACYSICTPQSYSSTSRQLLLCIFRI